MNSYVDLLNAYVDTWNRKDPDAMLEFFTEDGIYIDRAIGVELDLAGAKAFLDDFIGRYPVGFKVTVTHVCENPEQEMLAYEWDVEGASEDGVDMFIQGISMITMRGDKIARNVDYWDYADSPEAKAAANQA